MELRQDQLVSMCAFETTTRRGLGETVLCLFYRTNQITKEPSPLILKPECVQFDASKDWDDLTEECQDHINTNYSDKGENFLGITHTPSMKGNMLLLFK